MSAESSVAARSQFMRVVFFIALVSGALAFGIFWWDLDSLLNGGIVGLISFAEIFIGGRMLYSVFQFYQPKQTLSVNALLTIALLTLIVGHGTHYLVHKTIELQETNWHYLRIELHVSVLFFIFWVLFYEWWFLKNQLLTKEKTQRLLALQEDLKNAEIRVIQQNVQPHFLFNSLNSINSLILIDGNQAQEMVVKLSDFLRHSVIKNQSMFVSLKEEIDQIERYFAIEQIRFSSRLRFEIEHDSANDELRIPSMIVQPLVENAIKHGLYGQTDKTSIRMRFYRHEDYLHLKMENPYDAGTNKKSGTGFGLEGIRKKLYWLFAENHLLSTSAKGEIFETHLKIPLKDESITH